MFQKQHYEAIAALLRERKATATDREEFAEQSMRLEIAQDFCDLFREDNPRFDGERFLRAAGIW